MAPATVLGFLVGGTGLLLTGIQLKAANHATQQVADATELQAFSGFRRAVYDPPEWKNFNDAAEYLRTAIRSPATRFSVPTPSGLAIVSVAGGYSELAELFLADNSALPHARQLFGEPMACALLDFELIRTKSTNFHLGPNSSLARFVNGIPCENQVLSHGVAIGYLSGGSHGLIIPNLSGPR